MSDLISRQAAFIALHKRAESVSLKTRIGLLDAVRVISELPSVTPERKTGKWYWFGRLRTCSNCDKSYGGDGIYYFCPNCGADMREVQSGSCE